MRYGAGEIERLAALGVVGGATRDELNRVGPGDVIIVNLTCIARSNRAGYDFEIS